ncbi:MAG: cation:proton antiporter, partial [Clostridia bacterium]|nr:cation:proton antiporter [Clostridia bacterium]
MGNGVLLTIGIALLLGLLMSRLAKQVQLPAVTAYLVTGVLIGPFCLGALKLPYVGFANDAQMEPLGLLNQVALGFIAFAIGNEFRLAQLKKTGKQATVIGIVQAVIATAFVDVALIA